LSKSTPKQLISLAEAVPADYVVVKKFKGWYQLKLVLVTAVLERTCVIEIDGEKKLVNKHLLFVKEGFSLAVMDKTKEAMRGRVQRGWKTNWRRRELTA